MGFWGGLGEILQAAGEGYAKGVESGREYSRLKTEYRTYPDDRLARLWWRSDLPAKTAAYSILKERYGVEGAKELIRQAK